MRKELLISVILVALAILLHPAQAGIRINGNQVLEGAGAYTRAESRHRTDSSTRPAVAGPNRLVFSLGQGLMARGALPDSMSAAGGEVAFRIGIGLGYDIATVVYNVFCPIDVSGDVNADGVPTAADVITLVNWIFKSTGSPTPCDGAGDVNCDGIPAAADIITEVNFVFKSQALPCHACDSPLASEC